MVKGCNFRLLLGFLALSLFPEFLVAGVSTTIHQHYVSSRALGMGNAFVAVANDYNAVFYNPAGLARREDSETNLFLDAGMSSNFMSTQNEMNALGDETSELNDFLTTLYGKAYSLRIAPTNGIMVHPKWGLAIIPMDISMEMSFNANVGPAVNTTVYADTTIAFAYGDDFRGMYWGRTSWGITGKFVNRGYFSKTVLGIEPTVSSHDLAEGYTIDADFGLLWTPALPPDGPLAWLRLARPTFGAVLRNIGQMGFKNSMKLFNKNDTAEDPEKLYRVLDLGSKWEYPSFWLFGGRGVLDIKDIMHPQFNLKRGLHLGFEFDWAVSNWWRGAYRFGMSQGFVSAGFSAMFAAFNLDLVTYSDDVGTFSQPVESRQYLMRMSVNF